MYEAPIAWPSDGTLCLRSLSFDVVARESFWQTRNEFFLENLDFDYE